MLYLSEIWCYPIKSCGGISLQESEVVDTGLALMLINQHNQFISQREVPHLARIQVALKTASSMLQVDAPQMPTLTFALQEYSPHTISVNIWNDKCQAHVFDTKINQYFSDYLGMLVRLVYMPNNAKRMVELAYNPVGAITSFADGYPFLLISEQSLIDLNQRIQAPQPLKMNRFRPNLVLTGGSPYSRGYVAQDSNRRSTIFGSQTLRPLHSYNHRPRNCFTRKRTLAYISYLS